MSFVPFAALAAASFFAPQGSTALPYRSATHTGEMFASTVSSDLTRAYVGEGDQIAIVDISTDPGTTDAAVASQIALVPVDATVMGLVRHDLSTDKQVFIAGGSFGLLSMSATETSGCTPCQMGTGSCYPVVTIDDSADPAATPPGDNERWCWDVGVGEVQLSGGGKRSFVLALFSSQQDQLGTELRIYRRSTMALLYRVKMTDVYTAAGITPPSTAFGFGIDTKQTVTSGVPSFGNLVYVAMGTGGVIRVDLTPLGTGGAPTSSVGHVFTPGSIAGFTPALSVTLGGSAVNGIVRDVSVAEDGTVYAAVDAWGAVELDPATGAPIAAVNLFATSANSYADHIDATVVNNEVQIAVGGYSDSSIGEADAPFVTYGRFNYAIDVGGDLPIAYTAGQSALYYFHKPAGGGSTLPTTPASVSVGSNGGHFNLRPSPSSSTELWFYEQYWWHGGSEFYTPSSGPAVPAGFQWHKVSTASYAKNTRRYYAGLGASWLGMTRLLLDPNLVLAQLEGGHGSNLGTNYVDITNRDCLTHVTGDPNFAVTSVFTPKAHWTTGSGSSTEEWWVAAREQAGAAHTGFTLSRVTNPGGGLAYERWGLRSPRAPDCYLTRNYHQASMYQDAVSGEHRILGTFQTTLGGGNTIASPWAGVLYKRDTLMQRANLVTCYDGALFPDPPTGTDCSTTGTQCYFTNYPVGGGATAPNYIAPVVVHPELLAWSSGGTHLETNPMTFTGESEVLQYTVG
ncbi:MAG: hypothetical protein IT459_11890, partial [Planctomycetes bacterium]|nr:hypothetical protein [Planctomycetota bacterium]